MSKDKKLESEVGSQEPVLTNFSGAKIGPANTAAADAGGAGPATRDGAFGPDPGLDTLGHPPPVPPAAAPEEEQVDPNAWPLAKAALQAFHGSEKEAIRWIVQQLAVQLGSAPPEIRNDLERIVRELEFCC